jgi:hypothetical protein
MIKPTARHARIAQTDCHNFDKESEYDKGERDGSALRVMNQKRAQHAEEEDSEPLPSVAQTHRGIDASAVSRNHAGAGIARRPAVEVMCVAEIIYSGAHYVLSQTVAP